jgi:hypothetical protein
VCKFPTRFLEFGVRVGHVGVARLHENGLRLVREPVAADFHAAGLSAEEGRSMGYMDFRDQWPGPDSWQSDGPKRRLTKRQEDMVIWALALAVLLLLLVPLAAL